MREALRGLYPLTPDWADTDRLVAATRKILRAGAPLLQYRNKSLPAPARREQALALLALTRSAACRLIINDDLALACEIDADGVHLGADDGDPNLARRELGRAKVLGISCYDDIERARAAHAAGADYLAFGSFYASPTKPLARRAGFELFGLARREFGLPIAAIGGIQLHNAAELLAAGADLLAVITDLYGAAQPYTQACAYAALFAAETNLETHEETP